MSLFGTQAKRSASRSVAVSPLSIPARAGQSATSQSAASLGRLQTFRSLQRRAFAQPRLLLGATLLLAGAGAWWASAQNGTPGGSATRGASSTPTESANVSARVPLTPADLPALVKAYSHSPLSALVRGHRGAQGPVAQRERFSLTEVDLTPGNTSNEVQPAFNPTGDVIAFASNGTIDPTKPGRFTGVGARYHIFVIQATGAGLQQVTGFGADAGRHQAQPSFSPAGDSIVYVDMFAADAIELSQIAFTSGTPARVGAPIRLTVTGGEKRAPIFSPTGTSITFASNVDPKSGAPLVRPGTTTRQFDIFAIATTGASNTVVRFTGGTAAGGISDPAGQTADDLNPAYSQVNPSVLYFSSDRQNSSKNTRRRIWKLDTNFGNAQQVSDPAFRTATSGETVGNPALDDDDNPSPSISSSFRRTLPGSGTNRIFQGFDTTDYPERVSFESSSFIDTSDTTRDLNIWSLQDVNPPIATPTPPAPPQTPTLLVGGYTSGDVHSYDPVTGQPASSTNVFANGLNNPEDVIFGPDVSGDGLQDVFVSNREVNKGQGAINIYDGATGAIITGFAGAFTHPTGMIVRNGFLYVASGFTSADPKSTNKVYRYFLSIGSNGLQDIIPFGSGPTPQTDASFTFGETDGTVKEGIQTRDARVTNGIEGIAFGPDANDNGTSDLYACNLAANLVNVYDGSTGQFITDIVNAGNRDNLTTPTGLAFNANTMYVASSGTNQIKRFLIVRNPNATPPIATATGAPAQGQTGATFIPATAGLSAPERIILDGQGRLLVSNFASPVNNSTNPPTGGIVGQGFTVTRYKGTTGAPDPAPGQAGAIFVSDFRIRGAAGLALNNAALNGGGTPLPTPTPAGGSILPSEQSGNPANLESNLLSSPSGANANGANTNQGRFQEDKSADRDPAFARTRSSDPNPNAVTRIAFASSRPSNGIPGRNGAAPTIINPGGGPNGTHDIFTTGTGDFLAPVLVPKPSGNQLLFPFVAPGPQAPFPAPRTAEEGLRAGNTVRIACVLSEPESGLFSVSALIRDANVPEFGDASSIFPDSGTGRYTPFRSSPVNESIPVAVTDALNSYDVVAQGSQQPGSIVGNVPLSFYDDGPVSAGGHEQQGDAVKGDGEFYCEGSFKTPANPSDFYIDLTTFDVAGSGILYDNIWGFSTQPFTTVIDPNTPSNLFVSDYTTGQVFTEARDPRFGVFGIETDTGATGDTHPVESYLLTHPFGRSIDPTTGQPGISSATSDPGTLNNPLVSPGGVNVWRILCRGPIPATIINQYGPNSQLQLNPAEFTDREKLPVNPQTTRSVATANRFVFWSAPYVGQLIVGPGTIADSATQSNLSAFLARGGRLALSGRDLLFTLRDTGGRTGAFFSQEMQASYLGEAPAAGNRNTITGAAGKFTTYASLNGILNLATSADMDNPQFSPRPYPGDANADERKNRFDDGAFDNSQPIAGGFGTTGTDFIGPGTPFGAGSTAVTTPAYTLGSSTVGQRIEVSRPGGITSRAVFLTFGFEGINRRYANNKDAKPAPIALNVRAAIASGISNYFRTGGLNGQVTDTRGNVLAGFYVEVFPGNDLTRKFIVKTDSNGRYDVQGLPLEGFQVILNGGNLGRAGVTTGTGYSVRPARDARGRQVNPGFAANDGRIIGISGDTPVRTVNLSVDPVAPATIRGTAVDENNDILQDTAVLIVSVGNVASAPNGGRFVALTRTAVDGTFEFQNVPGTSSDLLDGVGTQLKLIFNPDLTGRLDPSDTKSPTIAEILQNANLRQQFDDGGGKRPEIGTRIIDDAKRPGAIFAPAGVTFTVDDIPTAGGDTAANQGKPIVVPLQRRTVTGIVQVETAPGKVAPVAGAAVLLRLNTASGPIVSKLIFTDKNGAYSFANVDFQTFVVVAAKDVGPTRRAIGNGAGKLTAFASSAPFTVRRGQDITTNVLLRVRNLLGRVTYNGNPAPDNATNVQLLSATKDSAGNVVPGDVVDQNGTVTIGGVSGQYGFFGIPAGLYVVRASVFDSGESTAGSVSVQFTLNVTDTNVPAIVPVNIINIVRRTLTGTVRRNTIALRGTVSGGQTTLIPTTVTGQVVPNAKVFLMLDGTAVQETVTNRLGVYSFTALQPGAYTVNAQLPSGSVSNTQTVAIANNATETRDLLAVDGSVYGKVTLNGQPLKQSASVTVFRNNVAVAGPASTFTDGAFYFNDLATGKGDYTVAARLGNVSGFDTATLDTTTGAIKPEPVNINLSLQSITGTVVSLPTASNSTPQPVADADVYLAIGQRVILQTKTNFKGQFRFDNVVAGTYQVNAVSLALKRFGGKGPVAIQANGATTEIGSILLSGSFATQLPPEFTANNSYLISVPYTDSADPKSFTTVAQAFSVPPGDANSANYYKLSRFNPLTQAYDVLESDRIQRGEGYLLQVFKGGVRMLDPSVDSTRIPMNESTFEITLRRKTGDPSGSGQNGGNLIGFPFDPKKFEQVNFLDCSVRQANGTVMTVRDAAAAGLISPDLLTLQDGTYSNTRTMLPKQGYYAVTFVDGLTLILKGTAIQQ